MQNIKMQRQSGRIHGMAPETKVANKATACECKDFKSGEPIYDLDTERRVPSNVRVDCLDCGQRLQ